MENKHVFGDSYSIKNKPLQRRYKNTMDLMSRFAPPPASVLDLGIENTLGNMMKSEGYHVTNTKINQDLDEDYEIVESNDFEIMTAFEIFEHMLAPYNLLKACRIPRLVATVPLNTWFTSPTWNENDPWDRHYHEFFPKQFDMLLERTGWRIIHKESWYSYDKLLGFRPILRRFYPKYYAVVCERS